MRHLFAVVLLSSIGLYSFVCNPAKAQTLAQTKTDLAAYAAEPVVIVSMDDVFRMQADGTGMQERAIVASIQSEGALKQLAVLTLPFAGNSQHVEFVYARVRHKDGTVTETPVDNAIEVAAQVTREAPFYSDLKEMQLPLRNLRVGDQLEWKGRIIRTKAEAPNQFWSQAVFTRDGVVLSETLTLDVPKDKFLNVWSPKFKPVETVEGDRRIYRWTSDNRKRTVGPEAEAAAKAEKKRVRTAEEETEAREGKLADVDWTTFKSWDEVGAWYRGLEADRIQPDAEIKAKVAQLTAGKTTELAKIQAVYDYVSLQIHYIGVSFGIGRYQPHSAVDVLANQYGDCKDKHTLLAAMLTALGLHPDAVLIGAGIRFNEAVPSPGAFNHLITRVTVDGKPTFLDSTAETAPFGLLMPVIRDQPALVVPESGAATVAKTAANPPFPPTVTMNAVGSLDAEGTSNSKIKLTLHGDEEVILRAAVRQLSPAQYEQFAQRIAGSLGYAGTATHLEMSRAEDTSSPFELSFDYKREKSGDWPTLRIVPQLYPVMLPRPDEKEPPVSAIVLGVPRVETSTATMQLPQGWTASLPLPVHAKSAWATYDLTYRFQGGSIYTDRRIEVLQERVPVVDWKAYNAFVLDADIAGETFIQLTRKPEEKVSGAILGGKIDPRDIPGPKVLLDPKNLKNQAQTTSLIREAFAAIKAKDGETGKALLDQAKALNPDQRDLWTGYGNLAILNKDMAGAIEDYQKEIARYPRVSLYGPIASYQLALRRTADTEKTLELWVEADPQNSEPLRRLATLELESNPAKAVTHAEAATALPVKDTATSEQLLLLLGKAQLRAGQKDAGHATLLDLANKTENPNMMNDSTYELANAGLELPLADQISHTALAKLEEESRAWTLDDDPAKLKSKITYLQATWDTIGWILFREGKTDEAESYVRAAWVSRQSAEEGKHLAEILLARGDKDAALSIYRMAIAASTPGDLQKELQAAAEKLHSSGAHESKVDAVQALRNLRLMPLGPGPNGVAEYKLLISAQGLIHVEPTGDKTLPGAEALIKRAKFSELFPKGSSAQLVLDALLNCHQGTCELIAVK